jgi:hypothetical protein
MKSKKKFRTIHDVYVTGETYTGDKPTDKGFKPLSEAYRLINEAPVDLQATKQAKSDIIDDPGNANWGFEDMSNPRRIANRGKLDNEEFLNVLQGVFGLDKSQIQVINPRQNPNPSSKFNMFIYLTPMGKEIQILLAGGGNAGDDYEELIAKKLQSYVGVAAGGSVTQDEVKTVFDKLDIDPEMVKEIVLTGKVDTSRAVNFDSGPDDVGKTVADITIRMETEDEQQVIDEHYISVKNKSGDTVYNGGNIPFIKLFNDRVVLDVETYENTDHPSKRWFQVFNVDPNRVATGMQEYVANALDDGSVSEYTETGQWEDLQLGNDNMRLILNAIASTWGYGYWYLREKGTDIIFEPILSAQDSYERVGEISSIRIKYPHKGAKALDLEIKTSSKKGNYKYMASMRNSSGRFLPLSIKVNQYTYKT